jgi:hypothetical protein
MLAGCTRSPTVVPVSGKVTLDGEPLANVAVAFQPVTDKANASQTAIGSYGRTDAEGNYSLRLIDPDQPGAIIGKHQVTLTTATAANYASDDLKLKTTERLPSAARSQQFEVPAGGTDQANFDLKSK